MKDSRPERVLLNHPLSLSNQKWDEDVKPLVVISCTTYMHAPFIRDAIEGFLMQQTTFRTEILIHDDASSDGTTEIVKEYERKYPLLIKGFYQKENTFRKKNKNALRAPFFEARNGNYIAICEGDDYWIDPIKLQKQADFLEANHEYSFCVGGFWRLYQASGDQVSRLDAFKPDDYGEKGFTFSLNDTKRRWLTQPLTAMYRKEYLDLINRSVYKYSRDVHLFYHLLKLGKGFYMTEHLGVHRIHPGGLHSMQDHVTKVSKAYQIYKELFEENCDGFTRFKYFHSIVKLLNANFYHRRWRNNKPGNLKLLVKAVSLIRDLRDVALLMSAVLPVHNNSIEKEN